MSISIILGVLTSAVAGVKIGEDLYQIDKEKGESFYIAKETGKRLKEIPDKIKESKNKKEKEEQEIDELNDNLDSIDTDSIDTEEPNDNISNNNGEENVIDVTLSNATETEEETKIPSFEGLKDKDNK